MNKTKILAAALAALLALSMTACGNKTPEEPQTDASAIVTEEALTQAEDVSAADAQTTAAEAQTDTQAAEGETEAAEAEEATEAASEEQTEAENKTPENDGFLVQEQTSVEKEPNTYDKDGLKIYGFEKCDQGICGLMENSSDKTFDRVIISVTFDDRQRNVVAEGSIDAQNVKPMTRTKLHITSDVEFHSFSLSDVTVE